MQRVGGDDILHVDEGESACRNARAMVSQYIDDGVAVTGCDRRAEGKIAGQHVGGGDELLSLLLKQAFDDTFPNA